MQFKPYLSATAAGLLALLVVSQSFAQLSPATTAPSLNPSQQDTRLRELGLWMAVNHRAVYGNRPWIVTQEGDIWYTKANNADTVYATLTHVPNWERGSRREFLLPSVVATDATEINVLGQSSRIVEYAPDTDATARFRQTPEGLSISVVRAQRLYNDHKWPNPVVVELTNVKSSSSAAQ